MNLSMKRYHRILKLSKKINHNDLIYYSNSKTKSKVLWKLIRKYILKVKMIAQTL